MRPNPNRCFAIVAACMACLWSVAVGCMDGQPDRIAIVGTVTLDGEPVQDATLILTPKGAAGRAAAVAIVGGQFALPQTQGVIAGDYRIQINPNGPDFEDLVASGSTQAIRKPKIPARFQRVGALEACISPVSPHRLELILSTRHP